MRDAPLEAQIIELQKENNQVLGRRKMKKLVEDKLQEIVSEARVGRIMKKLNLCSLIRRKSTYRIRAKQWQAELPDNLLNREFEAQQPGEKFVTDVTYIPYVEGTTWKWAYLSVVLDLYDRSVVTWVLSKKQDSALAQATLNVVAGKYHNNEAIFHSDRGCIYTSKEFQDTLKEFGFRQSLSRSGNCWDNAPMESFNGILKSEWLYNPHCYEQLPSFRTQQLAIERFMKFYNEKRIHSSIGYLTPNQKRELFFLENQNSRAQCTAISVN